MPLPPCSGDPGALPGPRKVLTVHLSLEASSHWEWAGKAPCAPPFSICLLRRTAVRSKSLYPGKPQQPRNAQDPVISLPKWFSDIMLHIFYLVCKLPHNPGASFQHSKRRKLWLCPHTCFPSHSLRPHHAPGWIPGEIHCLQVGQAPHTACT